VLGQGDYIGFAGRDRNRVAGLTWHAPVRVVTGASPTGRASDGDVSEPPIPRPFPVSATAYLDHPKCVMALVTDQSKLNGIDRSLGIRGGQIVGIQDIRSLNHEDIATAAMAAIVAGEAIVTGAVQITRAAAGRPIRVWGGYGVFRSTATTISRLATAASRSRRRARSAASPRASR
jgi:hypothetical protein